jgi:hypothetical protein
MVVDARHPHAATDHPPATHAQGGHTVSTTTRTRVDAASVEHDDATTPVDTDETADTTDPTEAASWVDRCQRRFAPTDARLHNLADDENHAMHEGV